MTVLPNPQVLGSSGAFTSLQGISSLQEQHTDLPTYATEDQQYAFVIRKTQSRDMAPRPVQGIVCHASF